MSVVDRWVLRRGEWPAREDEVGSWVVWDLFGGRGAVGA